MKYLPVVLLLTGIVVVVFVLAEGRHDRGASLEASTPEVGILARTCNLTYRIPSEPGPISIGPLHLYEYLLGNDKVPILQFRNQSTNSFINVDARYGKVVDEQLVNDSDKRLLGGWLSTVHDQPLDPGKAPWPYAATGIGPETNMAPFTFRFPTALSGLQVAIQSDPSALILANCRSYAVHKAGSTDYSHVTMADYHAFRRFFDLVTP